MNDHISLEPAAKTYYELTKCQALYRHVRSSAQLQVSSIIISILNYDEETRI